MVSGQTRTIRFQIRISREYRDRPALEARSTGVRNMLSVEECRKYLKKGCFSDNQIDEIKDGLYQLAGILVAEFLKKNKSENSTKEKHVSD